MDDRKEALIKELVAWGDARDDIRAAAVAGSYAYDDRSYYDEYSDLDIGLYTNDPSKYAESFDWIAEISARIWPTSSISCWKRRS